MQGTLRGFDQFMNLVLDETLEIVRCAQRDSPRGGANAAVRRAHPLRPPACAQVSASEQNKVGMVVIRGNSVVMIEALEKLWGDQ